MAHLYPRFQAAGVSLVAISADTAAESSRFAAEAKLPFPLLADPGLKVAVAYGVAMAGREIAVPSVFLIRRDGQIDTVKIGENMADRLSGPELLQRARECQAAP